MTHLGRTKTLTSPGGCSFILLHTFCDTAQPSIMALKICRLHSISSIEEYIFAVCGFSVFHIFTFTFVFSQHTKTSHLETTAVKHAFARALFLIWGWTSLCNVPITLKHLLFWLISGSSCCSSKVTRCSEIWKYFEGAYRTKQTTVADLATLACRSERKDTGGETFSPTLQVISKNWFFYLDVREVHFKQKIVSHEPYKVIIYGELCFR